jgi:periplasmic divalent cation tolerance protein
VKEASAKSSEKFCLVLTTSPNLEEAKNIAKALVDTRLAACVQIGQPVQSIYRWKEKLEVTEEVQIFIKTKVSCFDELSQKIRALHSFEVPEIISIPIRSGLEDYLNWLDQETR